MRRQSSVSRASTRRRAIVGCTVAEHLEQRRMLATFQVTTLTDEQNGTGNVSLREALKSAKDNGADLDTINFAAGLTSGGPATITLLLGELAVDSNVTVEGPGASLLTIDANENSRVLNVGVFTVAISGLTIINGALDSDGSGGGISNAGALDLTDVNVGAVGKGNFAGDGGGIFNATGATLELVDCTIAGNNSFGGGGISNAAGATVISTNSTIISNTAENEGTGGGVSNAGTFTASATNFTGNGSDNAAGAILNGGTLNLTDCTIDGNSAFRTAGGISSGGTATLLNCTISNNSVADESDGPTTGGGLDISGGTFTLVNCTLATNHANQGGGAYVGGGTATFTNCTVSTNLASGALLGSDNIGGGIRRVDPGTVILKNTIVADNTGPTGPDLSGSFTTSTFNLIGKIDGSTGITNGANGNKAGTIAAPIDAQLGALDFNGGSTKTMSVPATSPALNSASNANITGTETDQRGLHRIVGGTVDIGAYENQEFATLVNGVLTIDGTADDDIITVVLVNDQLQAARNSENDSFAASSVTQIRIFGNAGIDVISLGAGVPQTFVDAGSGNDVIVSDPTRTAKLSATGSGGNDTIVGGAGDDELSGANGKDRIFGSGGDDYLLGGAAKDYLFGSGGNDTCSGAGGKDRIFGDSGADYLLGGTGNDLLDASLLLNADIDGIDTLSGNAGTDTGVADPNDLVAGIENLV